jgi:hypothetical protein
VDPFAIRQCRRAGSDTAVPCHPLGKIHRITSAALANNSDCVKSSTWAGVCAKAGDVRRKRRTTLATVRLTEHEALTSLAAHHHGILCTMHPERGVDAVPVAYALDDEGYVGVPIDLVKPKAALQLQRERNLAADPRATLLAEHWDAGDWSQLWWVRAQLLWQPDSDRSAAHAIRLAERYPQYAEQPFARVLVLRIVAVTGWAAVV